MRGDPSGSCPRHRTSPAPRTRCRTAPTARRRPLRVAGAAVLFDELYRVERAALIPVGVVRLCSTFTAHTNSYRFLLRDEVWEADQVVDATTRLRAFERRQS